MSKKNFKQLPLITKEDYTDCLMNLIISFYHELTKYKRYAKELHELINSYMAIDSAGKYYIKDIPENVFFDIDDKLRCTAHSLLMLSADTQKSSMSYRMFRNLLEKNKIVDIEPLNEHFRHSLNELLNVRNWSFHNTQSSLVARKEVLLRKGYISCPKPVIKIEIPEKYEGKFLVSLSIHTDRRVEIYSKILQRMKKDYSVLIGDTMRIQKVYTNEPIKLFGLEFERTQLSYAIQSGSYDGADSSYDIAVLKDILNKDKDNIS